MRKTGGRICKQENTSLDKKFLQRSKTFRTLANLIT